MERGVSVDVVRRTLGALLEQSGRHLAMRDRGTGREAPVSHDLATSPDGFLPVFLVAADSVWRAATGRSFGIGLQRDPSSLLGYRAESVDGGPFSAVMLSMLEAIEQTARPGVLLMNDFDKLWRSIEAGMVIGKDVSLRSSLSPGAV